MQQRVVVSYATPVLRINFFANSARPATDMADFTSPEYAHSPGYERLSRLKSVVISLVIDMFR